MYGWAIIQKLPVDGFYWAKNKSQFNKDFIKNYNENGHQGYDVEYFEILHEFHNDSRFLTEKIKIRKAEKPVTNLHDKEESVIHNKQ